MNNHDNITDAGRLNKITGYMMSFVDCLFLDMEAEFIERNNNLKRSWNNVIDKIDSVNDI